MFELKSVAVLLRAFSEKPMLTMTPDALAAAYTDFISSPSTYTDSRAMRLKNS